MRLGCDVTAVDINPVAWFILKCTLEYPQRLANQQLPLPAFACQSREFMESYFKAKGFKGASLEVQLTSRNLQKGGTEQPELTGIETKVASVEADSLGMCEHEAGGYYNRPNPTLPATIPPSMASPP